MNKKNLTITMILLIIMQMMFIWHIDLSTGAIWRNNLLTNGFLKFEPMQIYHISLYGIIIISGLITLIAVHLAFQNRKKTIA